MTGHIQDLWFSPGPDGQDTRTKRHGKGSRWKARYIDLDGRERSRSFERKAVAEKFLTKVTADVLAGTYLDPDAGRMLLRQYVTGFWLPSRTWDARTREEMERRLNRHILPKLGDKRLDQLARSPTIISGWLAGLSVGARYAGEILHTLSSVLSAARDDGRIASNPCQSGSVRAPRPVQKKLIPWTSAQVAAARASMPESFQAMADCAAGLGLRQGEIIGLPLDCVDFLRRTVHVRVQVRRVRGHRVFAPPKSRRERDVPLPGNVSVALAEHIRRIPPVKVTLPWLEPGGRPHTETLIFTGSMRSAISATYWDRTVWRPAVQAAGLPPARENGLHSLRHYYASTLLRGGVDIKRVSAYLGHTSAAFTLATYVHLLEGDDDRALRDIEAALAVGRNAAIAAVASSE